MSNNKIPTVITDKNGKQNTVYKSLDGVKENKRLSSVANKIPPMVDEGTNSISELQDKWVSYRDAKPRWTRTEKGVRNSMDTLFRFANDPSLDTSVPQPPSNETFSDVRMHFSALHFAQEMLTADERQFLVWAEKTINILDNNSPNGFLH